VRDEQPMVRVLSGDTEEGAVDDGGAVRHSDHPRLGVEDKGVGRSCLSGDWFTPDRHRDGHRRCHLALHNKRVSQKTVNP